MKPLFYILAFLFTNNIISCQSKLFNDNVGRKIFDSKYHIPFKFEFTDRFTPSFKETQFADSLINNLNFKDRKKSNKIHSVQYLGYSKLCSKYLLIHIMFSKNTNQFIHDFPDWNKEMEIILDEENAKSLLLIVNLNDKTLGFY